MFLAATDATLIAAFIGGLISFLSPCVLPIVPGYLSLVTGVSATELNEPDARRMRGIAINTGLFVAGFTAVFVAMGLGATAIGDVLIRNQELLTRLSGVVMIVLALYLAGSQILMAPGVYREVRFHPHVERFGPFAAPVIGAAFAFGWTPCIGPILGSILTVAATQDEIARGGLLLLVYGLGLGVPFLIVGLAMGRITGALSWFKRRGRAITFVSAGLLLVFGVILLFDQLPWVTAQLSSFLDRIGLGGLVTIG